ncbi:MAG: hypothetical protein ACETWM_22815, partial [Candidatus Lokiarchaeia archaeon]
VAMNPEGVAESNYNPDSFSRDPISGDTDQQGWCAYKINVSEIGFSQVQLNRIPAVVPCSVFRGYYDVDMGILGTWTGPITSQPLVFPRPVFDLSKFALIVRISNQSSVTFDGMAKIVEFIDPNQKVLRPNYKISLFGSEINRTSVQNLSPNSHKDCCIFMISPQNPIVGEWKAIIKLWRNDDKEEIDSRIVYFTVKEDGKPTFEGPSCISTDSISGIDVFEANALSNTQMGYCFAFNIFKIFAALKTGIVAEDSFCDFFPLLVETSKNIQLTAGLDRIKEKKYADGTRSFYLRWWNRSEGGVSFAYDRAIVTASLPNEILIADAGNSFVFNDSAQSKTRLIWVFNGVDKQIRSYSEGNGECTFIVADEGFGDYEVEYSLCFFLGPFQEKPGFEYDNLSEAPWVYNYNKWKKSPGEVYWYTIATAVMPAKKIHNFSPDPIQCIFTQDNTINFDDGTNIFVPTYSLNEDFSLIVTIPEINSPLINEATDKIAREMSIKPIRTENTHRNFQVICATMTGSQLESLNRNAIIAIPYSDDAQNGIVDGTRINEQDLKMFHLDENTQNWVLIKDSEVNADENEVMAEVNHLSIFCLMALSPASEISEVIGYPIPCRPQKDGSFKVGNIPLDADYVEIFIYNIAGELVRRLKAREEIEVGTISKTGIWDCKNEQGEDVASGVYIYFLKSDKGKKIEKFAIIR